VGYSGSTRDGKIVIYVSSTERLAELALPKALSGLDIEFRVVGRMKALQARSPA